MGRPNGRKLGHWKGYGDPIFPSQPPWGEKLLPSWAPSMMICLTVGLKSTGQVTINRKSENPGENKFSLKLFTQLFNHSVGRRTDTIFTSQISMSLHTSLLSTNIWRILSQFDAILTPPPGNNSVHLPPRPIFRAMS